LRREPILAFSATTALSLLVAITRRDLSLRTMCGGVHPSDIGTGIRRLSPALSKKVSMRALISPPSCGEQLRLVGSLDPKAFDERLARAPAA